jgi:hypothetical protein
VSGVLSSGNGRPIDPTAREVLEAQLGHDFTGVRVHTDNAAARSAELLSAQAYTVGSHIVFNKGCYDPASETGRRILAHELTHVVQQRDGPVDGRPLGDGLSVSDPSDPFERQASQVAALIDTHPREEAMASSPSSLAEPAGLGVPILQRTTAPTTSNLLTAGIPPIRQAIDRTEGTSPYDTTGRAGLQRSEDDDALVALQRLDGNTATTLVVQREVSRADLLKAYKGAVADGDWQQVALRLNGFNTDDIEWLAQKMSYGEAAHTRAAVEQYLDGWPAQPDILKYLDKGRDKLAHVSAVYRAWDKAVADEDWPRAVEVLNGMGQSDINHRVAKLTREQTAAVLANAGGNDRIVKGITLSNAQSWSPGQFATADFEGEQEASVTQTTKAQLYVEITKAAPWMPPPLRVCLVGHAWAEQQGKGILNFNFAGVEGGSKAFVRGWTSAAISTETYENEADKSKYRDWDMKGHNPAFGTWNGHNAGTIAAQLALDPKPPQIVVCVKKRRPAYQSLRHAAAAFVHLIELRIKDLQLSNDPEHNALAGRAMGGDAPSYAYIVNHSFNITDDDGKKLHFGAYNGDRGYAHLVETQIAAAEADIAAAADEIDKLLTQPK